jgi:Rrf2 family protein
MLPRGGIHAIKALLDLGGQPLRWRSVRDLADSQALPAPMLEQLLLRLRRAGLLEARRGRQGGYRLAVPAERISLAAILQALAPGPQLSPRPDPQAAAASDQVTALVEQRLERALERELARISLADLLYDLRSAAAALSEEGGLLLG